MLVIRPTRTTDQGMCTLCFAWHPSFFLKMVSVTEKPTNEVNMIDDTTTMTLQPTTTTVTSDDTIRLINETLLRHTHLHSQLSTMSETLHHAASEATQMITTLTSTTTANDITNHEEAN